MSEVIKKAATNEVVEFLYGDLRERSAPVIFNSATGNPVVFNDGANGLPVKSLKVNFSPIQNGSGDPSLENIRSIVPWNGLSVGRINGIVPIISNNSGMENVNGEWRNTGTDSKTRFDSYVQLYKNGTYIKNAGSKIINEAGVYSITITVDDENCNRIVLVHSGSQNNLSIRFPFDSPIGTYTINFEVVSVNPSVVGELIIKNIFLVAGGDVQRTETDIVFQSPVYGGTLDVVSGVLTVQRVSISKKWSEWESQSVGSTHTRKILLFNDPIKGASTYAWSRCNVAPQDWNTSQNTHFYIDENKAYVWLPNDADGDLVVQVAGVLVTPQEITLTPEQITTLNGKNTIWSDANGNIEVEYRADTGLFLKQNTVKDVQVNGSSILTNSVANVPIATPTVPGVAIVRDSSDGLKVDSSNRLIIVSATASMVKSGTSAGRAITPNVQDVSTFYGLAKLAGADMAQSSNAVGTYTDPAKTAIQKMFGLDGILGDYELSTTASKAYAIGETFIFNGNRYRATTAIAINDVLAPGTNCELDPLDGKYVRNIDYAGSTVPGIVCVRETYGIRMDPTSHALVIQNATGNPVKLGTEIYKPLVPSIQHKAIFYGLAKLAGADMASLSGETVGVYPEAQIQAIQKLFGFDGILGDFENSATASKAYAIGETFIYNGKRYRATAAIAIGDTITPGTNCELDPIDGRYVKFTDKAGTTPGVVRIDPNFGVGHRDAPNDDVLMVQQASVSEMKSGYGQRKPVVPSGQHIAVYYALAKLAGADMASLSGETVGVYPQAQKAAIQTMLGIEADIPLVETITGSTVSITGMPNVRYICETAISELTITPPASGSIVVRFTAGSNCIVSLPQTVKLPAWFDISSLEDGTTYEIIITDGVYGGVMSWA